MKVYFPTLFSPFLPLLKLRKSHCSRKKEGLGPETCWGGKGEKRFHKCLSVWIVTILLGKPFYILASKIHALKCNLIASASIW
jgi:hypothetical protein